METMIQFLMVRVSIPLLKERWFKESSMKGCSVAKGRPVSKFITMEPSMKVESKKKDIKDGTLKAKER